MKVKLGLNADCERHLPKVQEVWLFDDDSVSLLLTEILLNKPSRTTGMHSFGKLKKQMFAQVSFYELSNEEVVAIAYPCSYVVDYWVFKEEMKRLFSHVENCKFDSEPFSFLLYLQRRGYHKRLR